MTWLKLRPLPPDKPHACPTPIVKRTITLPHLSLAPGQPTEFEHVYDEPAGDVGSLWSCGGCGELWRVVAGGEMFNMFARSRWERATLLQRWLWRARGARKGGTRGRT